ncbi:hypothetical protein C0J52_27594 [Blattella germanica]|nr:hypothetical protein C0J52_27594 [Blattella germanica]
MRSVSVLVVLLLYNIAASTSCPDSCNCDAEGELQCRNAGFSVVPEDLEDPDKTLLDLSFNSISVLNSRAFEKIPTLKTLIITDNNIESVEPEAFNGLEDLETVDLRNNAIGNVHPTLFQNNPHLTSLDLSNNKLETFQLLLTSELKHLNLSLNQLNLEGISSFAEFASLESLDLSNNNIVNLTADLFSTMANLKTLNIASNPLDYSCELRTVWALCTSGTVECVYDNEPSWKMLENLNCDGEVTNEPTTTHAEDFINVDPTGDGSEVTSDNAEEGSGGEIVPVVDVTDSSVGENTEESDPSDIVEGEQWIMIVIIACSVFIVLLVIIIAVVCFLKRRNSRVEAMGSLSQAHSIEYLNQEDEFNRSYKRSDNPRRPDVNKARNNNYDRVVAPPNYTMGGDPARDVIQLGENAAAEIVRVPSFKTHGIATPLNLPEEVCPVGKDLVFVNRGASPLSKHSLPRSSPASSYDGKNSLRAGSLRRYAKQDHESVPDIQLGVPPVRTLSNKRR